MNMPVILILQLSAAVHKPASELSPGSELGDNRKPPNDKRIWLI
jgi:hypothetical protein